MRLKSVLIISTLTALTCASSFPSGLNFGAGAGAGSSERNDPDVKVLLNGVDTYGLRLIGGAGQTSLTENPQLRRTSIGLYDNDGVSKSGNGRPDRINGLNQENDRFRIFRFGSIFRAGNRIRSGRKGGRNGENGEGDNKDKGENVDSSNEDDATSENIVDDDDDDDDDDNFSRSSVSLYPLATAEIVKGPQQLKCVTTALPDHQPWVLGAFTTADPLRLISSPSAQASDSSPVDPPPGTGASELWCFVSYQDVMHVLISLDIPVDNSETSSSELSSSSPSAQAPTPLQSSQTTQLISLTMFGRTQAQGVINMPIPSSPSFSSSPNDAATVNNEDQNQNQNQNKKPSSSSSPQPVLLRTAAVIEGPPNLTCRIIYYSSGRSGPLQGQGFNMTKPLEMANTAIEGARYVYCDDVPMDEYVGDMPFMPS